MLLNFFLWLNGVFVDNVKVDNGRNHTPCDGCRLSQMPVENKKRRAGHEQHARYPAELVDVKRLAETKPVEVPAHVLVKCIEVKVEREERDRVEHVEKRNHNSKRIKLENEKFEPKAK